LLGKGSELERRSTIQPETANYQVLFGNTESTIVDGLGEVLYHGDQDIMEMPYSNQDGSGVNICKLTGGLSENKKK